MPTTREPGRPLRRDAQRNRDALVAAARTAFAEEGLEAPLDGIARRAGVAIGTLYRNFPTRVDLVEAVATDKLNLLMEAGEEALAMDDPWQGFVRYLERLCELQASDRGFNDLASMRFPQSDCIQGRQNEIHDLAVRIVGRAQAQGSLRPDVTAEDLAFIIWSHSRIAQATKDIAPRAWRRYLALMLDAFRADRAAPLGEPPMRADEVYRAMVSLADPGVCSAE